MITGVSIALAPVLLSGGNGSSMDYNPDAGKCPTPHKQCWPALEHAETAAADYMRVHPKKNYRSYLCKCGWYHHSTKPFDPSRSARMKAREEHERNHPS